MVECSLCRALQKNNFKKCVHVVRYSSFLPILYHVQVGMIPRTQKLKVEFRSNLHCSKDKWFEGVSCRPLVSGRSVSCWRSTISNTRATFAYYSFCDNLRLQCTLRLLSLFAVIFKLISSEKK